MLSKKDFIFDRRLAERFIKRGALSRQDYLAYLDALPDVADKGMPLSLDEEEQQQPATEEEQQQAD